MSKTFVQHGSIGSRAQLCQLTTALPLWGSLLLEVADRRPLPGGLPLLADPVAAGVLSSSSFTATPVDVSGDLQHTGDTISVGPTRACRIPGTSAAPTQPHIPVSRQLLNAYCHRCTAHPELSAPYSSAATSRLQCSVQALHIRSRALPSTAVSVLRRRRAALLCAGSEMGKSETL